MSNTQLATLHFSVELRDWILHSLQRGTGADDIVRTLAAQRFDPAVARALVEAFQRVVRDGLALPTGSITIERHVEPTRPARPRLPHGAVLRTADRDVRVLSRMDKPVVAVLEAVLSDDECDALIAAARPRLTPSTTVDPRSGESIVTAGRSSMGMFFRLEETALLARIDRRVSALMQLPVENGEGIQVLRYTEGARSSPHFDFLIPGNPANQASLARSGQRVSTLVIYLNDVTAGGETVFPELGLSVLPRKGNALYFEYCDANGQLDGKTLHAANEVLAGEKWVATKWMRQRRFVVAGEPVSEPVSEATGKVAADSTGNTIVPASA